MQTDLPYQVQIPFLEGLEYSQQEQSLAFSPLLVPRLDAFLLQGGVGKQQGHEEGDPQGRGVGPCSNHQTEVFCLQEVAHHKICLNQEIYITVDSSILLEPTVVDYFFILTSYRKSSICLPPPPLY